MSDQPMAMILKGRLILVGAALGGALGLSPTAHSEVFVLKSGGRVEGELLNGDRASGQPYLLRTAEGVRFALAEAGVQRVIVKSELDKQYEALLPKTPNTPEGQWAMAEWCKEAGLLDERKRHMAAVIALDPNHEEARKALGYQRYGSRWLTQEEYMQSQGYVRHKGAWRVRQEVEIESRGWQNEQKQKDWRKDIRRWFEQLASGGRHSDSAARSLNQIDDPLAAPALVEILADGKESRAIRKHCLELLGRLPPGLGRDVYIRIAMDDSDDQIRDGCLEELKRQGTYSVLPDFIAELKSKNNNRVNRAAECLERLADKDATLPLIEALKTEHKFLVSSGPPGGMSLGFGGGGSGSGTTTGTGGGLGGMSMGGKPKVFKKMLENRSVRAALTTFYPGINYQFDEDAWRDWYIRSQTSTAVDLRRSE